MRHRKHNHQLGVKSAHRISLVANLSSSLIEHGRIKTTLAKARALRPVIEKIITLAKKAHLTEDAARKIHYRRLAIAKVRNKKAVSKLFDELVEQFLGRNGGYTRIYKLALPRLGDAADMALIEFVEEAPKKKGKKKKSSPKKKNVDSKVTADKTTDADKAEPAEPDVAVVPADKESKSDEISSDTETEVVVKETTDSDNGSSASEESTKESK
jgi:large subunit ribosomal protein L17